VVEVLTVLGLYTALCEIVTDVSGESIFMGMGLVMNFGYTGCPEDLRGKFCDELGG